MQTGTLLSVWQRGCGSRIFGTSGYIHFQIWGLSSHLNLLSLYFPCLAIFLCFSCGYLSIQPGQGKQESSPTPTKITAYFFPSPSAPPPQLPHLPPTFSFSFLLKSWYLARNRTEAVIRVCLVIKLVLWIRTLKLLLDHINTTEESIYYKGALASWGFTMFM